MTEQKLMEAVAPERPPRGPRFNPDGNERLTAMVGVILIVLTVVELGTLLLGLQTYLHLHVFVGLVLLPPIAVKLASIGWRFARYYTRVEAYRLKGAPQALMRMLAPLLVLFTVLLFGSGVAMGFVHGNTLQIARGIHGPSAFLWTVTLGVHVLVYARRALHAVRGDLRGRTRRAVMGARLRASVATASIVCGLVVACATLPVQHAWLHLPSHHDRNERG